METLSYKGFEGSVEVDMASLTCRGKLLFIDDLVTYQADSPKDIQAEFESAVEDYLDTCKELGRQPKKPYRGVFNVRITPQMHKDAALRAVKDDTSLNEVVSNALKLYMYGNFTKNKDDLRPDIYLIDASGAGHVIEAKTGATNLGSAVLLDCINGPVYHTLSSSSSKLELLLVQ
jgi:predicted HicB family RNase H-like nuclease